LKRLWAVDDLGKGHVVNAPDWGMEKAWPDFSAGFDHGRNPWRIAAWSYSRQLSQVCPEMHGDAPEFFWTLPDKTVIAVGCDEAFDFMFQIHHLSLVESDRVLPQGAPAGRPVKGCGTQVSGEKGDGVKTDLGCAFNRAT
jgi:hypothetical protein